MEATFLVFLVIGSLGAMGAPVEESPSSSPASIVDQHSFVNGYEGAYDFGFETSDGTKRNETLDNGAVHGSVQYVAPDGSNVSYNYTADAHGYRVEGERVPQTPPEIARAIKYIEQHSTDAPSSSAAAETDVQVTPAVS